MNMPGTWYVYRLACGEPDRFIDAVSGCSAVDARITVGLAHGLNPQCLCAFRERVDAPPEPGLDSAAPAVRSGASNH